MGDHFFSKDFTHKKLKVGDCDIDFQIGGSGPPLLLLHGFPETKVAWNKIASLLATDFTLVLPDIPGYGDSTGPAPDKEYNNYSKRSMGDTMLRLMQQIGFNNFAIAGHDRGGRIAYRMALDHPDETLKLAMLNIIPTLDVIDRFNYDRAYNMEPWVFLAQPTPFPETLLNGNTEFYLNYIFDSWCVQPESVSKPSRQEYLRCFRRPEVTAGICAEYRAIKIDIANDNEDRKKTKKIQCPVLLLWSENDFPDPAENPLTIWNNWAENVTGKPLACGHFLMEEVPDKVYDEFKRFF